ncbi:ribosome silencing factor [Cupriavidus sp. CV2]|uniref:ribosome silencing factor n=1 Tax=Cupriavidus ulmosensis TaxID=3065913 RepID=UPI00296ABEF3|nr:ribosome silencing factor [Cupriavidus sp. CV2]MDW3683367.1 ribosome silencing factor [Cupriavidus sp. CV2]
MDIRKLQRAIVDGLEDVKAQDIKVYDTTHLTELFDRVVIASGSSNRQTKALAASVRDTVKDAGGHIVAVEGLETGEWVLVDCGDAVVHIMQPQLRMYYNLEELWGDKPVRLKLSTAKKGLAKASEPIDGEDEDEAPVVRTARRATGLRPALARLPEGMKEPSPPLGHEDTDPDAIATNRAPTVQKRLTSALGSAPARKAPAKTAAPRKSAAGTGVARKTATKTAATKTAAKAPAKTAAAKAPVARKRTTRSA